MTYLITVSLIARTQHISHKNTCINVDKVPVELLRQSDALLMAVVWHTHWLETSKASDEQKEQQRMKLPSLPGVFCVDLHLPDGGRVTVKRGLSIRVFFSPQTHLRAAKCIDGEEPAAWVGVAACLSIRTCLSLCQHCVFLLVFVVCKPARCRGPQRMSRGGDWLLPAACW